MTHILIGAVAMAGLMLLIHFTRKQRIKVTWWQWILTVFGFAYVVFVAAMVIAFLDEGAGRAALIMGLIFGFIAVLWGVLLGRFVFSTKRGKK